jgi:hypothetical protein
VLNFNGGCIADALQQPVQTPFEADAVFALVEEVQPPKGLI